MFVESVNARGSLSASEIVNGEFKLCKFFKLLTVACAETEFQLGYFATSGVAVVNDNDNENFLGRK